MNNTDITTLSGLSSLWSETLGDPNICIAVLDGPVDQSHPSFDDSQLTKIQTLVTDKVGSGRMSLHGTHITSVIFGQHNSPVHGIAPNCRGLIIPVFSDNQQSPLSQLDLARAINQAVEEGAHVINISGGQLSETGEAEQMLTNAVKFCNDNGVLIVAAAGNDACQCLHVPAALPSVLAVGAMDGQGLPFDFSNWGDIYQTQGILAPGENILGAMPGGGTIRLSGTSFATPIVSGVIALLLSLQIQQGETPNPQVIRDIILKSALPCNPDVTAKCDRFLVGSLNISKAKVLISEGETQEVSEQQSIEATIQPSEVNNIEGKTAPNLSETNIVETQISTSSVPVNNIQTTIAAAMESGPIPTQSSEGIMSVTPSNVTPSTISPSNVKPSEGCGCDSGAKPLIYALGTLNYDFGTEARRDSFRQLMPDFNSFPANPFDARQMVEYLVELPEEAPQLIWTLNIELTPVYAIEPIGPYAREVYDRLVRTLEGQIQEPTSNQFVERVSIPGYLSGRAVTLFSGQVVPVVVPQLRGFFSWNVNILIDTAIRASGLDTNNEDDAESIDRLRTGLREFLNRLYFDLRNLGQTSQERALNYSATNAFQAAQVFAEAGSRGLQLDTINVEPSPFCRMDSDCWDVRLTFFDPDNNLRARRVFRFTIDVSDIMPVTIGDVRSWSIS